MLGRRRKAPTGWKGGGISSETLRAASGVDLWLLEKTRDVNKMRGEMDELTREREGKGREQEMRCSGWWKGKEKSRRPDCLCRFTCNSEAP